MFNIYHFSIFPNAKNGGCSAGDYAPRHKLRGRKSQRSSKSKHFLKADPCPLTRISIKKRVLPHTHTHTHTHRQKTKNYIKPILLLLRACVCVVVVVACACYIFFQKKKKLLHITFLSKYKNCYAC